MIQKRLCSLITKVDQDFYVMLKVRVMVMQNVNVLLYRKIPLIRPGRIYGQIGLHISGRIFGGRLIYGGVSPKRHKNLTNSLPK